MWTEQKSSTFLVVVVASIAAHVALVAFMPSTDATTPTPPAPTFFTIAEPTPPPPPPAPAPETEPTETAPAQVPPPRAARPTPRRQAPPPKVAAAEPPAGPEAPVDFSGVTLSNEDANWSSPTGNGEPMTGPISAGEPVARKSPVRSGGGNGTGTDRVVAVGDLSRPPKAPNLDEALAANYPREARRAGVTGKAVIRARILADGNVGTMRIASESGSGFGEACKRTLAGSRWQAPLDAQQKPVITDISYTCTFAVAR